ncbi:MAG: hypothetical protein KBT03_00125 [Bacteroidales bacterium]|nr:hypothetical protein [Candidatus Scybalousia scybalohippi]
MREQFEKLPEIANLIQEGNAFYCDKGDWYLCPNIDDSAIETALDMAWYTFQEVHKELLEQQKRIDTVSKYLVDSCGFDKSEVQELLK